MPSNFLQHTPLQDSILRTIHPVISQIRNKTILQHQPSHSLPVPQIKHHQPSSSATLALFAFASLISAFLLRSSNFRSASTIFLIVSSSTFAPAGTCNSSRLLPISNAPNRSEIWSGPLASRLLPSPPGVCSESSFSASSAALSLSSKSGSESSSTLLKMSY